MRYLAVFLAALLLCCPGPAQAGTDASADALLTQMAEKAATIASIDSQFIQTRSLSFLDEELVSEGYFHFRHPGELLWHYEKPVRFCLEYRNGQARFISEHNNTGQSSRESRMAKAIAEQILPWITFDLQTIRHSFAVTVVSRSPITLQLVPKQDSAVSPLKEMRVVFTGAEPDVSKLFLYEKDGDVTRLEFFATRRAYQKRP